MRKDFKWINLTQLIFSTIFGYFVDLAKWIVGDFAIPTYAGQLLMLAISILLVAIGVSLYMGGQAGKYAYGGHDPCHIGENPEKTSIS